MTQEPEKLEELRRDHARLEAFLDQRCNGKPLDCPSPHKELERLRQELDSLRTQLTKERERAEAFQVHNLLARERAYQENLRANAAEKRVGVYEKALRTIVALCDGNDEASLHDDDGTCEFEEHDIAREALNKARTTPLVPSPGEVTE